MNETEGFDKYCGEHPAGPLIRTVISVPCYVLGVPASVWLLWILSQRQHISLSNDIYTLNLTVMDFIYNMSMIPVTVNYHVMRLDWIDTLSGLSICLSISGRPQLMSCVCVDCYMAVVYPIQYMNLRSCRYRVFVCALVWVSTVAQGLMFILVENLTSLWFLVSTFAALITVCCDGAILCTLRKPDPSGRSDIHPQKQRSLQVITNSLIMTLVSYLPPLVSVVVSHSMSLSLQEIQCNVIMPISIFTAFASVIMPLLHLNNLGKFQNLRRLWCHS